MRSNSISLNSATDCGIVGNLPYNISTPLLFHLLNAKNVIVDMHFMLQKEVVDRICAQPGSKSFGRLTIMLGCYLESVSLFDVSPDAFTPPPRVNFVNCADATATAGQVSGSRSRTTGACCRAGIFATSQDDAECAQGNRDNRAARILRNRSGASVRNSCRSMTGSGCQIA